MARGGLDKAEQAFEERDFAAAARLAQAITGADPGQMEAWLLLASAQDQLGRASQAITALEQAIAHNPQAAAPHNALAPLYLRSRDLARAETHLRRAVEIDPAFAPAWHNLGKLCAASGRRAEAEQAFQGAVAAAPDEPVHRLELARFSCLLGRLADAERLVGEADQLVTQEASLAAVHALRLEIAGRMADTYLKSGQPLLALGHLEQAVTLGAGPAVQTQLVRLLLATTFSAPRPSLKPILKRALEERWADPMQLGRLIAKLILLEPDFRSLAASAAGTSADAAAALTSASTAPSDPLLLSLLQRTLIVDVDLERLLVNLRRGALRLATQEGAAAKAIDAKLLPFLAALANQSFTNEYAFALSEEEAAAFAALLERGAKRLNRDETPDPAEVAILAAYGPLHVLLDVRHLTRVDWPAWLEPVITRQVREPLEEARRREAIPDVTAIRDPGSLAVQQQYEDNPFPRWIDPPVRTESRGLSAWVRQNFAGGEGLRPLAAGGRYDGLVAGCGTGQDTASLSQMFSDISWFAIDPSAPSLAYAARKAAELGLENVSFARADPLELGGLERRFDVVVSAGALRHLDDPLAGLRVLRDVTAPGGVMLITLYSTLARRELVPARAFAAEGHYGVSAAELRRYRADVLNLPAGPDMRWRDGLLRRDDFYSLSMLRDLIFVHETTFTITRLEAALTALDLRFCGFSVNRDIRRGFGEQFGAHADPTSLAQWARFEMENPDAFWNMYQFMAERA